MEINECVDGGGCDSAAAKTRRDNFDFYTELDRQVEELAQLSGRAGGVRPRRRRGHGGGRRHIRVAVLAVAPLEFSNTVERELLHLLGPRINVPIDAMAKSHQFERIGLVLGPREKFGNAVLAPDLPCVEIKFTTRPC